MLGSDAREPAWVTSPWFWLIIPPARTEWPSIPHLATEWHRYPALLTFMCLPGLGDWSHMPAQDRRCPWVETLYPTIYCSWGHTRCCAHPFSCAHVTTPTAISPSRPVSAKDASLLHSSSSPCGLNWPPRYVFTVSEHREGKSLFQAIHTIKTGGEEEEEDSRKI